MTLNSLIKILIIATLSGKSSELSENYTRKFQESLRSVPPLLPSFITTELNVFKEIIDKPVKYNEDTHLNISQLVNKYGFGFQEHEVQTKDGYILNLHRIPRNGPPVFLMHGILLSSDDFVTAGPNSALAYHLANEGFDVWIGNARGNKHSRRHVKLRPNETEFWDFSWHEIGIYDLPACVDYILDVSKADKLSHIGFSQGSTSFYVFISEMPEYAEKIAVHISLSPVSFVSHTFSPILRWLVEINILGSLEASGPTVVLRDPFLVSIICTDDEYMKLLCGNVAFLSFGFNEGQTNLTNLPVVLNHAPAGCSTKQLIHYRQSFLSGKFRKFDYGTEKNIKIYGTKRPPNYQVGTIKVPIALFYSRSDWISSAVDVEILKNKLPNVIDYYELKNFNHLDFVFGKDLKRMNKRIVKIVKQYQ